MSAIVYVLIAIILLTAWLAVILLLAAFVISGLIVALYEKVIAGLSDSSGKWGF